MHFNDLKMRSAFRIKSLFTLCMLLSLSFGAAAAVQSHQQSDTLYRQDIFKILSEPGRTNSTVTIMQNSHITNAFYNYIESASKKRLNGFRIRIFFDNRQDAREASLNLENSFRELYPGVGVYRTYTNPYFKVTIGDFRNRSDAMRMLKDIERTFPAAFIVREQINFPPL